MSGVKKQFRSKSLYDAIAISSVETTRILYGPETEHLVLEGYSIAKAAVFKPKISGSNITGTEIKSRKYNGQDQHSYTELKAQ